MLAPLLEQQPAALVIANRTVASAQELAELFAPRRSPRRRLRGSWTRHFDLVINATAASLAGELPPLPPRRVRRRRARLRHDVRRATRPSSRFARAHGATTADGLGMLVEQAAEAFPLWRGVRPDTAPVLAACAKIAWKARAGGVRPAGLRT